MKFLRNAFLLLLTVILALGNGGVVWGATPQITGLVNSPDMPGHVGGIAESGSYYTGKVYYFGDPASAVVSIPFHLTASLDASANGFLLSTDVGTLVVTDDSISAGDFEADVTLTVTDLTYSPPVITLTLSDDQNPTVTDTVSLNLTYSPVDPKLSILTPGSAASMDFYINSSGNNTISLSGGTGVSGASFDIDIATLSAPTNITGLTFVTGSQDIGVSFDGSQLVSADDSFNVATGTGGIVVTGDNNALVAGSSGQTLGAFTVAVLDERRMTVANNNTVSLSFGQPANVSYPITMDPHWNGVESLTIATGNTASSSTATSVRSPIWSNDVTISVDYSAASKKLVISGTPDSVGSSVFRIFANGGGNVLASRDVTVSASAGEYRLLLGGTNGLLIRRDITYSFNDRINVTVSGDSAGTPLDTLTLYLSETSSGDTVSRNGLTIKANVDTAGSNVTITGSPEKDLDVFVVRVNATFGLGAISEASLYIIVQSDAYTLTLDPEMIRTAQNVTFGPVTVSAVVSADSTVTLPAVAYLTVDDEPVSSKQNGITAAVTNANTLTFSGTPISSGKTVFLVRAYSAGGLPLDVSAVQVDALPVAPGSLFGPSGEVLMYNSKRGTEALYNGNNLFVGIPFDLSFFSEVHLNNLTVSCTGPGTLAASALLREGLDYYVRTDSKTGKMKVIVYFTPEAVGEYTFYFGYDYDKVPYTENVILTAVKEKLNDDDDSSGGCSTFVPGAVTALLALVFCGFKRHK